MDRSDESSDSQPDISRIPMKIVFRHNLVEHVGVGLNNFFSGKNVSTAAATETAFEEYLTSKSLSQKGNRKSVGETGRDCR